LLALVFTRQPHRQFTGSFGATTSDRRRRRRRRR
jgi:hypothetical protein